MTEHELEDWLADVGHSAIVKAATAGKESLGPEERIIYEVWLFDIEALNRGVSQYFCNRGVTQWNTLRNVCHGKSIPILEQFMGKIQRHLDEDKYGKEPYLIMLDASPGVEELYESYRLRIITELMRLKPAAR